MKRWLRFVILFAALPPIYLAAMVCEIVAAASIGQEPRGFTTHWMSGMAFTFLWIWAVQGRVWIEDD